MVLFVNISSHSSLIYLKTILNAFILMLTIGPLLSIMSKGDTDWLLFSLILWTIGSTIIFYPFMEHIYPHILTRTSSFLLTSVLIIISTWFNITLISYFFPSHYIYTTLINLTLNELSLFALLYLLLVSMLISILNTSQLLEDNS